jgi:hypothetical protein
MVFVGGVEVDEPQSMCCLGSSAVLSRFGNSIEENLQLSHLPC